jgi:hypothetical protein
MSALPPHPCVPGRCPGRDCMYQSYPRKACLHHLRHQIEDTAPCSDGRRCIRDHMLVLHPCERVGICPCEKGKVKRKCMYAEFPYLACLRQLKHVHDNTKPPCPDGASCCFVHGADVDPFRTPTTPPTAACAVAPFHSREVSAYSGLPTGSVASLSLIASPVASSNVGPMSASPTLGSAALIGSTQFSSPDETSVAELLDAVEGAPKDHLWRTKKCKWASSASLLP